jgi:hypothetical protein
MLRSGLNENIPFSLSRWTDVPGDPGKWAWFKAQVAAGEMVAIDPRNAIPYIWSLRPEDTLGLVFWTKDPTNLIHDAAWLQDYRFKIHVTLTGWEEVEKGAPTIHKGGRLLAEAIAKFGHSKVTWRFSPVPLLASDEVVTRFRLIAPYAKDASVYLSFLQTNDLIPETRGDAERIQLMLRLAEVAEVWNIKVLLCNEDRTLLGVKSLPSNLAPGICAPPEDFAIPSHSKAPSEGCGCILMADPFTINESCTMGCRYCYAADKELSGKKRNTTRHHLPVVP